MLKLSGESVDNRGYMLSVGLALVIFVLMLAAFRLTQGKKNDIDHQKTKGARILSKDGIGKGYVRFIPETARVRLRRPWVWLFGQWDGASRPTWVSL